jgi:hypothetical protein
MASTWLGETGWDAERFEFDGTFRRLGTGGGGGGFANTARRACAGLSGRPRGKSIEAIITISIESSLAAQQGGAKAQLEKRTDSRLDSAV